MNTSSMIERMKRGTKILLASGFAAVVAAACMVSYSIPSPQARDAAARIEASVSDYRGGRAGPAGETGEATPGLFASAYQRVQTAYVRPIEDDQLLEAAESGMREAYPDPSVATDSDLYAAAIQGMLASLDDYSVYMDRNAFDKLNQEIEGEFGGLGIEIKKDPLGLEVISPIDDTPAMRAGLRPGDRLTHADGVSLAEMSLRETVDLLRGAPGTSVTVTVIRGDQPAFDVPLEREVIQIQRVRARLEGDIGYLRISHFLRDTGAVLRREMGALRAQAGPGGLKGYVVDLRSNPGGLLSESIDVAGTFLSGGLVVSTRSRTHEERFTADLADPSQGLPVVVLINEGSASASEIVAGAIKYRDRGIVVGQRSFGKGSVQTTFPFNGGGGLKLTTALYYTPGGKTVDGGIEPNVEAMDDPETPDVDEALEIALDLVRDLEDDQALHARDPDGTLAQ